MQFHILHADDKSLHLFETDKQLILTTLHLLKSLQTALDIFGLLREAVQKKTVFLVRLAIKVNHHPPHLTGYRCTKTTTPKNAKGCPALSYDKATLYFDQRNSQIGSICRKEGLISSKALFCSPLGKSSLQHMHLEYTLEYTFFHVYGPLSVSKKHFFQQKK